MGSGALVLIFEKWKAGRLLLEDGGFVGIGEPLELNVSVFLTAQRTRANC